ncbi:hypothetical protein AB0G73_28445 [Streptomyces sp. NPDC020719]|uniref:hypothetical protein n=1 Tax=Streptomyces sp. NPDC020719 TaxID=3154896 RepID=UPI0034064A8E
MANRPGRTLVALGATGRFSTSIAAETNADGRVELFGVNSSGCPYHRWQTAIGGPWSGWEQFDGLLRH